MRRLRTVFTALQLLLLGGCGGGDSGPTQSNAGGSGPNAGGQSGRAGAVAQAGGGTSNSASMGGKAGTSGGASGSAATATGAAGGSSTGGTAEVSAGGSSAVAGGTVTGGTSASAGSTQAAGSAATGTPGGSSAGRTSTSGGSLATGGSLFAGSSSIVSGAAGTAVGGTSIAGGSFSQAGQSASGTAGAASVAGASSGPTTSEVLEISDVWSGHPVSFSLVTRNNRQFAAYYDAQRRMTVASRTLGSTAWSYQILPSTLGWDSHNYVAMALDSTDQIHVSGNMHAVPLVYYRSTAALDISTLAKLNTMVGTDETQVTYPVFFDGPAGNLVFEYRAGASGNGNTIFNTYSTTTRTWTRTLNTALLNGTSSSMNAYPEGPVLGPDGYWHLVWVWRNTADASTNHDLSYAKTQDLVHWFKGDGTAITLPITPTTGDIVDPVPVSGGMINNNTRVGFDAQNRPIIAYHKFDSNGYTQLYEARLENGKWVIYCATDWTYRWSFGGTGTLVFAIIIDEGPKLHADGSLIQNYYHSQYGGNGTLVLDPTTLHADTVRTPPLRPYPLVLDTPESTYKDPISLEAMVVRWAEDSGKGPESSVRYMLRWETLPSNRDVARSNIPPATKLRLYAFRQ